MNRFDKFGIMYVDASFSRWSLKRHQEQVDFKNVFIIADMNTLIIYKNKFSYECIEQILQRKIIDR